MSWQNIEQLWRMVWELHSAHSRLEGRVDSLEARQDRSEDELHEDKLHIRDIIPAVAPALLGLALVGLVIAGKLKLSEAASMLLGR